MCVERMQLVFMLYCDAFIQAKDCLATKVESSEVANEALYAQRFAWETMDMVQPFDWVLRRFLQVADLPHRFSGIHAVNEGTAVHLHRACPCPQQLGAEDCAMQVRVGEGKRGWGKVTIEVVLLVLDFTWLAAH